MSHIIFNTILYVIEYILYEKRIQDINLPEEVVFILGNNLQ